MKTVNITKKNLMEILTTNLKKHKAEFEEAEAGYREEATAALQKALADALDGKEFSLRFDLAKPYSYAKDYERVIRMLELNINDEVTISSEDFSKYVMDDWQWMESFLLSNARYSKKGL